MDDSNPYASPEFVSGSQLASTSEDVPARRYWRRFSLTFALIVAANFVPLYFTWKAWRTDFCECIGVPFTFFSRGGVAYSENFYPIRCLGNLVIACVASHLMATMRKDDWRALFHRLRTWGTPDSD
jgi:hypothetical protein